MLLRVLKTRKWDDVIEGIGDKRTVSARWAKVASSRLYLKRT